jgi:hypothetical protein
MIEFRMGDMLDVDPAELEEAEVVFMEVVLPASIYAGVTQLMLKKMAPGTRVLMFADLKKVWTVSSAYGCPFHQLEVNKPVTDTFMCSWGYVLSVIALRNSRRLSYY